MKRFTLKCLVIAASLLAFGATEAQAQGWLKKLGKGIENVAKTGEDVLEKGTDVLNTLSATDSTATDTTAAGKQLSKEQLLENVPHYTVKKVIELGENGDTLRNDDGTIIYKYRVFDKDDKACDPDVAQKMVKSRLKAYGTILAKVGGGAALGALGGLMGKNKKDAIAGAAVGGLAGLAMSGPELKKIKQLNKSLKEYNKTLAAYKKTFNEEGLPIDASIDLSDVDGVDFTKSEELTKDAAEVKAELAASKLEGESLEDIDIDV